MPKNKKSQKKNNNTKVVAQNDATILSATEQGDSQNIENAVQSENNEVALEVKDEKASKKELKAEKNVKDSKKDKKTAQNDKNKKKGNKNDKKEKGKARRKVKETFAELKKVTWPSFGDVCKKTGVVLVVVIVFAVVVFGIDYCLGLLMGLLR